MAKRYYDVCPYCNGNLDPGGNMHMQTGERTGNKQNYEHVQSR